MAITNPTLPPKAGYVEVEVDGVRTYKNVQTGVLIHEEEPAGPDTENDDVWADMAAAIVEGVNEV
jgi:hypothetical protein